MKKLSIMMICIALIMVHASQSYGQKIMMLNSELKANSKPLEVRIKGISTIGKYEFGPYRIVSGKAGWGSTRSSKRFADFETRSESKSKSSFVFVANNKDTILVNNSLNSKFRVSDFGGFSQLNQSTDNWVSLISPPADTSVWKLIVVSSYGTEVKGKNQAEGVLTDGVTNIQIKAVKQWEDGKSPMFKMICGYELSIDSNSVAAVQSGQASPKRIVWLNQNLNEPLKSIIAAAVASLVIYTDYASADKMN